MAVVIDASASTQDGSGSPTVARRMLLIELNKRVKESRRSLADIAQEMGIDDGTLGRWLDGKKRNLRAVDIQPLLAALGFERRSDVAQSLFQLADAAKQRGLTQRRAPWMEKNRFDTYVGLEAGARSVVNVEPFTVPGLLQTEGFAEWIIRVAEPEVDDAGVAERVALRMRRQESLRRPNAPLQLRAIIDESVIRRPVPDQEIWRGQLQHLVDSARRPNITVLVIPFAAGPSRMRASFSLLDFPGDVPSVAYTELPDKADYEETPDGIARYRSVVDQLTGLALPPEESAGMISGPPR